ncbi:inositol hexakisphosphate and diphosphoinositol-pentakisphosphate kinase 2-like [Salvelinus namaycush]|uniref:Inositol hexakisphosphate and diphosphoinositol-pentakisphosphate kinase n=1 Tax=Salvelinus namaycush TaxID=8040 RepID=A0A8U0R296_SALNM|nr:inositol hexakisphosphate and diphosphoinositol-pentakisphosphate kinase 2-like [Salvelinus namaycush]
MGRGLEIPQDRDTTVLEHSLTSSVPQDRDTTVLEHSLTSSVPQDRDTTVLEHSLTSSVPQERDTTVLEHSLTSSVPQERDTTVLEHSLTSSVPQDRDTTVLEHSLTSSVPQDRDTTVLEHSLTSSVPQDRDTTVLEHSLTSSVPQDRDTTVLEHSLTSSVPQDRDTTVLEHSLTSSVPQDRDTTVLEHSLTSSVPQDRDTTFDSEGDYAGFPGCGLLRLHSTYRHDLKIYASDEGRVQMTAAAFAKGLLALEGELTPILVQMVKSANMNGMLDSDSESLTDCQQRVKVRLHEIMQKDQDFTEDDYQKLAPTGSPSLVTSMKTIGNPVRTCDQVYALIQSLTSQIRRRLEDPKSADLQLYHSETLELMLQRWSKLERDFRNKSGRYDISKIPDIYDCVKYDTQHNATLDLEDTLELFRLSRALADIVIPQEYGINKAEKMDIAQAYCLPLMKKIQLDLQRTHEDEAVNKLHPLYSRGVMSPGRHVRTRLYFTSESHVHSLLSIFRYGGLLDEVKDQQWKQAMDYLSAVSELNYMTQIVIMLYEDNNKDPSSEERFHVELHFSPGVKGCEDEENVPLGFGFRPASAENQEKQTNQGSLEDLSQDETDQALSLSEPIGIKRSPMIRNRKTGSMEVLSETLPTSSKGTSYRLFPSCSCQSPEIKQTGLGFEGCSMVPSIYPLETLHNSLSLKQVDKFLNAVCEHSSDAHAKTMKALSALFDTSSQGYGQTHIYPPHRKPCPPQKLLSGPPNTHYGTAVAPLAQCSVMGPPPPPQ